MDGSTHSGGCTATRVLEGGPQRLGLSCHTWTAVAECGTALGGGVGKWVSCLVTWTRKLSAHELVLCPSPYYVKSTCSMFLPLKKMAWDAPPPTSHRLMSSMNRPANYPPTLPFQCPGSPFYPALERILTLTPEIALTSDPGQPRLRPKSVSPLALAGSRYPLAPELTGPREVGCGLVFTRLSQSSVPASRLSWNVWGCICFRVANTKRGPQESLSPCLDALFTVSLTTVTQASGDGLDISTLPRTLSQGADRAAPAARVHTDSS